MSEEILGIFPSFMNEDAGGITINNKDGTPAAFMAVSRNDNDNGMIFFYNKYGKLTNALPLP